MTIKLTEDLVTTVGSETYNRTAADVPAEVRAAVRKVMAEDFDSDMEVALQELIVADYVVFLLALDTYMRYLTERFGSVDVTDPIVQQGLRLLRTAERMHLEAVTAFIKSNIVTPGSIRMLDAAARAPQTAAGAAKRAFLLRTVLSKGGTTTTRAVFGSSNKARREVQEAIEASMMEDEDAALNKFSSLVLRNKRLEAWIDKASEAAQPDSTTLNSVSVATKGSSEAVQKILQDRVQGDGFSPADQEAATSTERQAESLLQVEDDAREAARKVLNRAGEEDRPLTKSEIVGVATAVATAIVADPDLPRNIPTTLQGLDPEQMAAAMSNGKVLVAAGAGSGKTSTLTARVAYLVKDCNVDPSRIMAICFNKKASREIGERIAQRIGDEPLSQMSVGTMHSMFRKFIVDYGNPEEKAAMTTWMMPSGDKSKREVPSKAPSAAAMAGYMSRIWKECFPGEEVPKKTTNAIQKWMMNDITPEMALERGADPAVVEWYKWFLGFKGVTKNWAPPCNTFKANKAWGEYLAKWRDNGRARLGDFSDMILIFRDILKRNPAARKKIQSMYDHIAVDEAQDLNEVQHQIVDMMSEHVECEDMKKSLFLIGDEIQCVHEDTEVSTPNGRIRAVDLRAGDKVLSYRNGDNTEQRVAHVKPSSWSWGYKITTESGKTLTMSPNHRIWSNFETLPEGKKLVYLMFRNGFGFRVGLTSAGHNLDNQTKLAYRGRLENADCMWILDVVDTETEALLLEETYSLQYGIPKAVFNGHWRGVDQARLNEVFKRFGSNGLKLLGQRHLDPTLPHWRSYSATRERFSRRVIQMVAHNSKGSIVSFEWSGTDINAAVSKIASVNTVKNDGRYRVRKYCNSYRDALAFALELSKATGAEVNRRLSMPETEPYQLVTASGLFVGMSVPVRDEDSVTTEEIVSVEKVDGKFVDLDVDDASNFFGGDILSHNSINHFVGARPDLFTRNAGKDCFKTRSIATNYRCMPEIIELANKLMENHPRGLPMAARPDARKPRGVASIVYDKPDNHASGAISTVNQIAQDVEAGAPLSDYAVLTRTNAEINDFETACIIQGVPYARRGSSSFLQSPETKTVMSYFNLAVGQDFERMQKSLVEVLNKPNRFFLRAGEAERIVEDAISRLARKLGVGVKAVNPLQLFDNLNELIDAMDPQRRWENWKVRATREQLEEMAYAIRGMRDTVEKGVTVDRDGNSKPYTTQDLIGDILAIKGVPESRDKPAPTLRDVLMPAGFGQEEEADDPDEDEKSKNKPIGNVEFLFKIAQSTGKDDDPSNPRSFKARIDKLAADSKDLRVDLDAWDREQQNLAPSERKGAPCVVLSTIHSVKGAQWNNVTVVMAEGVFPHKKSMIGATVADDEVDPALREKRLEFLTERQLAYVAFTRAAKNLTVMSPGVNAYGKQASGDPLFVKEAGLRVGQNVEGKNDPRPTDVEPVKTVLAWTRSAASEEGELERPETKVAESHNYSYSRTGYDRRDS